MKKSSRIMLILAFILALFSAGTYFINKIFLPIHLKAIIIKNAEASLHRKVTFDAFSYNIFKGLTLNNITIASKDEPGIPFLHIDTLTAQIFYPALLRKNTILSAVHINNLSAQITRINSHTWNFSDILQPTPTTQTKAPLLINELDIRNARFTITDLAHATAYTEIINQVNIKGSLSFAGNFRLTGHLALPATQGSASITLVRDNTKQKIKCLLNLHNIAPLRYLRFLPSPETYSLTDLTIQSADTEVLIEKDTVLITGKAQIQGIDATPSPGYRAQGDLALNKIHLTITPQGLNYEGDFQFQGATLSWGEDRSLSGNLSMNKTRASYQDANWTLGSEATIEGLFVSIGNNQRFQSNITLSELRASQIDNVIKATSNITLNNAAAALDKDQSFSGNVTLANTAVTLNGPDINATADILVNGLKASVRDTIINATLSSQASTLSLNNDGLDVRLAPVFTQCDVKSQGLHFTGTPSAMMHAVQSKNRALAPIYNGTLHVTNGTLTGIPFINKATEINGSILLENDTLSTRDLSFATLGSTINANGKVSNLDQPIFNLSAKADNINLAHIQTVSRQLFKNDTLDYSGTADLTVTLKGPAHRLGKDGISALVLVKDASISSKELNKSLQNINGNLSYKAPILNWNDLSLDFQDKTYVLNGSLNDLADPLVSTTITTDNLDIEARFKKENNVINIEKLSARTYESSADISGKVYQIPDKEPVLDIRSSEKIALRDLPKIFPELVKPFADLKISGILKANTRIKGPVSRWQEWNSSINIESPILSILGYKIENISGNAEQKDGLIQPLSLKGDFYQGSFGLTGTLDLKEKGLPFQSSFKMDNTSLELLKRDSPLKDRQLSGLISVNSDLTGQAADLQSFKGTVAALIKDGYLLELEVLSRVLTVLSSSFQGGDVIISNASATFNVNEGYIDTNNLRLKSATVTLLGEGSMDLARQNMDFNIIPQIDMPGSADNSGGLIESLNPTTGLLNIHVGGTLQDPKVTHNLTAPTVIKKTLQNTVGGLLKLFE